MNIVDPASLAPFALCLGGVYAAVRSARRWWLRAQPDEWLLCVRDGRLVAAGVGISLLRRPGDVVVRFSSTMQWLLMPGFWHLRGVGAGCRTGAKLEGQQAQGGATKGHGASLPVERRRAGG